MKKVILLAGCFIALATSVSAQEIAKPTKADHSAREKKTPEQRAQKQMETLSTEVNLTPEQKPKVYDLFLTKVKKADEINEKYKTQPKDEAKNKELVANRKQTHQNLKVVLTPEQFGILKAKQKERKAGGKENPMDKD
ncbi:MAG: hypothetical protein H7141_13375 [Burkholderiales bacterium]|nr:hypothetical protein [Bacteroidia bacterium]